MGEIPFGAVFAIAGVVRAAWLWLVGAGKSTVIGAVAGAAIGAALGAAVASAIAAEPTATLRNGVLAGWEVTTDNEVLLCSDPIVFIRAKQIECP